MAKTSNTHITNKVGFQVIGFEHVGATIKEGCHPSQWPAVEINGGLAFALEFQGGEVFLVQFFTANKNLSNVIHTQYFQEGFKTGVQLLRPTNRRFSIDVAEGLATVNDKHKHGDYSSIDVLGRSGYQVAHWSGHVAPDDLGKMLNQLMGASVYGVYGGGNSGVYGGGNNVVSLPGLNVSVGSSLASGA